MTYEAFISRFEFKRRTQTGFMLVCPAHDDSRKSPSLSASRGKDGGVVLHCFAGCDTKSVVNALGLNMSDLFAETAPRRFQPPKVAYKPTESDSEASPEVKPEIETTYSYRDAFGKEVYQAVRMKPKSFRQRHLDANGNWVWSMTNVQRVLYHLPEVLSAKSFVFIVEGEKDADNLTKLGFVATCNVGGAGKWLDGYSESLAGKDVVICGDNDEPGQKHVELVAESIASHAKTVRIIRCPGVKDASDYIAKFKTPEEARAAFDGMVAESVPMVAGQSLPIYSMADIEPRYKAQVTSSESVTLDLSRWLPSFRRIRPLIPGEMALIVADTGVGKTAVLSNIHESSRHLRTLIFEMELPLELMFERQFALHGKMDCRDIWNEYRTGGVFGEEAIMKQFPNLFICPQSKITLEQIESYIMRAELKMGERPAVVMVDYAQLIKAKGDRYEKTSDVAEGLKILAKSTRTILIATSQVNRASSEKLGLHSAKDSGSLENSAGLVLGVERGEEPGSMTITVLKCTKGGAGLEIPCNFDGAKMLITERAPVADEDAPKKPYHE